MEAKRKQPASQVLFPELPFNDGIVARLATSYPDYVHLRDFSRSFQSLVEPGFEPPAHAVQAWINLFPSSPEPKKGSLRHIIAYLVCDSFDQPMLAEVRAAAIAPRPFLYRAGDIGVDVKIEVTEANQRITLAGQVLSGSSNFLDNTAVGLESGGIIRYQTRTNESGEFSFEVPKDTYHLSIELPEGRITIFDVHPRKAGKQ